MAAYSIGRQIVGTTVVVGARSPYGCLAVLYDAGPSSLSVLPTTCRAVIARSRSRSADACRHSASAMPSYLVSSLLACCALVLLSTNLVASVCYLLNLS